MTALGALKAQPAIDRLLDRLGDPSPTIRAAAVTALAAIEGPEFLQVLSGVDPDPDWTVRAAVVTALGTLGDAVPEAAWKPYLDDTDRRTWPATMKALGAAKTPEAKATVERLLRARLTSEDVIVRATAAEILGDDQAGRRGGGPDRGVAGVEGGRGHRRARSPSSRRWWR